MWRAERLCGRRQALVRLGGNLAMAAGSRAHPEDRRRLVQLLLRFSRSGRLPCDGWVLVAQIVQTVPGGA